MKQVRALTPRQQQICDLLLAGFTQKEAGFRLGMTPKLVSVHKRAMLDNLGLNSLVELGAWGVRTGRFDAVRQRIAP